MYSLLIFYKPFRLCVVLLSFVWHLMHRLSHSAFENCMEYKNLKLIRISAVDFHVLNRCRSRYFTASTHQLLIQNHPLSFFGFFSLTLSFALYHWLFSTRTTIIMQANTEYAFIAFDVISLFIFNIIPYAFRLNRLFVHSFLF